MNICETILVSGDRDIIQNITTENDLIKMIDNKDQQDSANDVLISIDLRILAENTLVDFVSINKRNMNDNKRHEIIHLNVISSSC